ncbi:MAG: hypothetical protein HC906_12095 [Bacteroidales bacterium]|nr:hypothetical protein [Bacteroidales bacterium]
MAVDRGYMKMKIHFFLAATLSIFFSTCEKESPAPPRGESNQIVIQTTEPSNVKYRNALVSAILSDVHGNFSGYGHC